eukprot:CAMPEP_0174332570 /NCGR_PEP_ID=MMETSP0810-20121108/18418_1 /TAXON_ID=73025 ORGANISM="Eutreptiella gymnastica-like, Strain CCMP1594" /NCGR_SAMPLE_ID=MMETSP0810 /ASSEMBLY_ACC=CAM_ASM_000659 /LENGTH=67 /DNA_ID=CAMNT_0015449087 /DNA_START=523 /DNA_END=723 /DNA_ORIENTATION=-
MVMPCSTDATTAYDPMPCHTMPCRAASTFTPYQAVLFQAMQAGAAACVPSPWHYDFIISSSSSVEMP